MNQNNNHPNPNVNPSEPPNERGSILKPALVALALLAVSGSLLYAMVVTKPSAPTAPQPAQSAPLTASPKAATPDKLTAKPSPCATGDSVTVTLKGSDDDTNVTMTQNTVDIGAANTSGNDWSGSFTAGDFGGDIALVAKNNGKVVATTNVLVVKLTGITIDTTPGLVDNFRATVYPDTQPATNFAGGDMTWGGDVVAGNNNGMAAGIPKSHPVGPITAIATLGDISITNYYAVDFVAPVPTNLIVGGSGSITAVSTPTGRHVDWEVVSNDPGVKVSFAKTNTLSGNLSGAVNTIIVATNSASGNVVIEAYDHQIGDKCGTQATIQIGKLALNITDWNGNIISSANNNNIVIVGQNINLTAQTSGGTFSNFQWTVPGYAISNFVVAADASSGIVVSNFPTTNSTMNYYWVDGGSETVSCSAVCGGVSFSTNATFTVVKPTATVTTQTGNVIIGNSFGNGLELDFGALGAPGISFSENVIMPNGYYNAGNTGHNEQWVQLSASSESESILNGTNINNFIRQISSGLDTTYPYPNETDTTTSDSPGGSLHDVNEVTYSMAQNCIMWLMFKPSGGNWVPVKTVAWNWSGSAEVSGGSWSITSSNWSPNPPALDAKNYPTWTHNSDPKLYPWTPSP